MQNIVDSSQKVGKMLVQCSAPQTTCGKEQWFFFLLISNLFQTDTFMKYRNLECLWQHHYKSF